MPKRTASGVLLSDDSMWWWDGSRWHPATAATSGRPPRAPGSPWPWVLVALIGLLLVIGVPGWVVWTRAGGAPGVVSGYRHGFASTYVQQRKAALAGLRAKFEDLSGCERTGTGPCYPPADTLRAAAAQEQQAVRTESSLFFFPSCLDGAAGAEVAALQQVHDSAEGIRLLPAGRSAAVQIELRSISDGLAAASAAVDSAGC